VIEATGNTAAMIERVLSRPQIVLAGRWLLCAGAYVLADWGSYLHPLPEVEITPWSPATGIAFAMAYRHGAREGAWILFASGISNTMLRGDLLGQRLIGFEVVLSTIALVLVAVAVSRGRSVVDSSLRGLLRFLAAAALAAGSIAVIRMALLQVLGPAGTDHLIESALSSWAGDAIGIVGIGWPLLRWRDMARWIQGVEAGPALGIAFSLGALVFTVWIVFGVEATDEFKFFYLLFLPVALIALWQGIDGAATAIAVTQIAMLGFFQFRDFNAVAVAEFQALLLVLAMTGLVIGAVIDERRGYEARFRESEAALRARIERVAHRGRLAFAGGFAGALAHELRQPLTAIRAYLRTAQTLIGQGPGQEDRAAVTLEKAVGQVDHAGAVLDRLRAFTGTGARRAAPFDATHAARDAIELASIAAKPSGAKINLSVDRGSMMVHADYVLVVQILLNLLYNAIEAVAGLPPERRMIALGVSLAANREAVAITVRDHGPGLPPPVLDRLFLPFTSARKAGLGLGLSLSRVLARSMVGDLALADNGPDGATFRLTLPVEEIAA